MEQCLSVSLSIAAWAHSIKLSAAGLLLWARWARDINQLLQQQCAAGKCTQCRVVSICRQLNMDLFASNFSFLILFFGVNTHKKLVFYWITVTVKQQVSNLFGTEVVAVVHVLVFAEICRDLTDFSVELHVNVLLLAE